MKTILYFSASVLIVILLCKGITTCQTVGVHAVPLVDNKTNMIFRGRIAGDWKGWLTVEVHNGSEWNDNGFDPCYTHVVSDYKPLFRKLPTGQYEIIFVSEIAEHLP